MCVGSILAGMDHILETKLYNPEFRIVVNMSFGGPRRDSINESILALVHNHIMVVTSAGNESMDACSKSPASAEKVLTVGSTNYNDEVSIFSNYGYCVDIHAPGNQITSSWIRTDTDLVTLRGTSSAAAHVTGVVALVMEAFPEAKPTDLYDMIVWNGYTDVLSNVKEGSPNLLLNTVDKHFEK